MNSKKNYISIVDLANGERVGLAAIEITTIPHLSILQKRFATTANIDTEYKQNMARLLSEVFQNYKKRFRWVQRYFIGNFMDYAGS